MKLGRYIPLFVIATLAVGCAQAVPMRAGTDAVNASYLERPELRGSLFAADQQIVSDEVIEKILSSKVVPPPDARIIVLRFGQIFDWSWWSAEFARLDQTMVNRFLGTIRSSPRVASAEYLPSMLMPEKPTVPYLRQAAARCQADLVLIYRAAARTYEKQRLFASNEVKACCQVEAVLLDTRTCIVVFTTVAVQDFTATKTKDDFDYNETVRRAELEALGKALDAVAADVVTYFNGLEATPVADAPAAQPTGAEAGDAAAR